MWKKDGIKRVKDYQVIPGESVTTQHKFIIMEVWCSRKKVSMISKKRKTEKEFIKKYKNKRCEMLKEI